MSSNVRSYTDLELIHKVKSLPSFKGIPKGYWIIGVRSLEDEANKFDDKFYIFKGEQFVEVMSGTTNSGEYGLLNWKKWSPLGLAHIKDDEWYYDVWKMGMHRKKVVALTQHGAFKVLRDNNNNLKSGDVFKWKWEKWKGLNFHPNTYNLNNPAVGKLIGKWSVGCQVVNQPIKYKIFMNMAKNQKYFTYVLLKEF